MIDTLKRAQKEHELLGLYRKYLKYDDIDMLQIIIKLTKRIGGLALEQN